MENFPRERVNRRVLFHEGTFAQIVSLDNLFLAWCNYRKGKRKRRDIQEFEYRLEDNIFQLHKDLAHDLYRPGKYQQFKITDPKARMISKASVRDRLLHQAIYQILYPIFDKTFIFDSYSCRNQKGTHKAFRRLVVMVRHVSKNNTISCWALKMDIRKFFDSVDHKVLLGLLEKRIEDPKLLCVLKSVIDSFNFISGKGMPLGNLTSQLFANIYLDPLDKFVKHRLKSKYYLRYADDFLLIGSNPEELLGCFVEINSFLKEKLQLNIHPNKIHLRKLSHGIDFVGYVALPGYQVPRRKTVERIFRRVGQSSIEELGGALFSCLGYLRHVSSAKIEKKLMETLNT